MTKTTSRSSVSSTTGIIGGPPSAGEPMEDERPGIPDLPASSTSPQPRRDSQGNKPRRYSLQPQRHVNY